MFEQWTPLVAELLTSIIILLLGYVFKVYINPWILDSRRVKQIVAAKDLAYGIWIELEEHLPKMVGVEKMNEMKAILNIDFPLLSDAQLTAINKEIHNRAKYLYELAENKAEEGSANGTDSTI